MSTESVKTNIFGHVLEVTLDSPKENAIDLKTSKIMGDVFCDFRD
ncbi:MAG: carnitinyl-CoA dehydratase, partial [Rhodobacterales bacterium]|nr:carnitinyl-CoA dehydratase [Rhodobacterales bacterium]